MLSKGYYRIRGAMAFAADRVVERCDQQVVRLQGLDNPRLRAAAIETVERLGAAASLLREFPRYNIIRLSGALGDVIYIGDTRYFNELQRLLFPDGAAQELVGRAPLWAIPSAVQTHLRSADLVVCGLSRAQPSWWRPQAPLAITCPVWVNQALDIRLPLEQIIAGRARREVRYHVQRRAQFGLTAHATRDRAAFDHFHDEMYIPHLSRRHGPHAEIEGDAASHWRSYMSGDSELLVVSQDGKPIAGTVLRYSGTMCFDDAEGIVPSLDSEVYRSLQTALWAFAIERARERGMTELVMGWSLARCADPVFRSKRRWGAYLPQLRLCGAPEWTFLADDLRPQMREHLNAQGLITFVGGRPMAAQFAGLTARGADGFEGVDGILLVGDESGNTVLAGAPETAKQTEAVRQL